jgi:hypothetical protein
MLARVIFTATKRRAAAEPAALAPAAAASDAYLATDVKRAERSSHINLRTSLFLFVLTVNVKSVVEPEEGTSSTTSAHGHEFVTLKSAGSMWWTSFVVRHHKRPYLPRIA